MLAMDQEDAIRMEYDRHLSDKFVQEWWRQIVVAAGTRSWRSSQIPARHRQRLLRELRFDPADLKFVGVAYRAADKLLVSEDGDDTSEVQEYLRDRLGVRVMTIAEALQLARDP